MKKSLTILAAFLLLSVMLVFLTGCPAPQVTEIQYLSGIKSYYYMNDVIDPTQIKIKLIYDNGTSEEVYLTANDISGIDTSEYGEHTAVITYMGYTLEKKYTVREIDYKIYAIEEPSFVTVYKNNITEQENKNTEFTNRECGYFVGNENPFIFMPKALALNKDDELVEIDSFPIAYTLYVKNGNEFIELSGAELEKTVTVDTEKGSFKFSEEAADNVYMLSVRPYIIEDDQNEADVTKTFEFTVINGYNVYSAKDLAVVDNSGRDAWTEFKEEIGLSEVNASSVILHTDISVTENDFPADFIFDETEVKPGDADYDFALGSLKDYSEIYFRDIGANEAFSVIGNYFSLDASKVPLVVRTDDRVASVDPDGNITDVIISHATLFKFESLDDVERKSDIPQVIIENLFTIGNSNRSENALLSGGLIFNKIAQLESTIRNIISNCWYITFFAETMETNYLTVSDSKAYDSFNCLVYSWGGNISIERSELIGAGGPVIIADHCKENTASGEGGFISSVKVDEASVLESYVTGSEGWFQQFNATSTAASIKMLSNGVFSLYGASFTTVDNTIEKFNLIAVYKSGSATGPNFTPIRGNFSKGEHTMDFEGVITSTILDQLKGTGAPLFQSNGTYCFFNGSALINPLTMQPVDGDFRLFDGEYLNLFIGSETATGYMGIVFGGLHRIEA